METVAQEGAAGFHGDHAGEAHSSLAQQEMRKAKLVMQRAKSAAKATACAHQRAAAGRALVL
eukprot:6196962-Pleurochrysis_carterae.AAC.3